MSYFDRHIAPLSAKPSSLAPLFASSTRRSWSLRIGGPIACHPSHAARSSGSLRDEAIVRVMSSTVLQLSAFDGSGHHLPLPYADSSRAMILVSSSDSAGFDGVA